MSEIIVKMSQIMDPYDQAWSPAPDDQAKPVVDPNIIVPPDTEEETPAAELARQFQPNMVRIGPEFFIEDRVVERLLGLKSLGFKLTSKMAIMIIASLSIDEALVDDLQWITDAEWPQLISYLVKTNDPRSVVGQSTEVNLLMALNDLNFPVDLSDQNAIKLLQILARDGGPFGPTAANILKLDDKGKKALMDSMYSGMAVDMAEGVPPPPKTKYIDGPLYDTEGNPVKEDTLEDDRGRPIKVPQFTQYIDFGDDPEPWKSLQKPNTKPTPAQPTDKGPIQQAPVQQSSFSIETPALPSKNTQSGAIAKSKQMTEFANEYEDRAFRVPGVQAARWGDIVEGVKVLPADKTKGNDPIMSIKGGDFVRSYVGNVDAMVIGKTNDGLLAVRIFPSGEAEAWDVKGNEVRKSQLVPKRTVNY